MYRVVMSLVAVLCASACSMASVESDAAVPAPVADVSTVTGAVSFADPHAPGIAPKNCGACHADGTTMPMSMPVPVLELTATDVTKKPPPRCRVCPLCCPCPGCIDG